MLYIHELRDLNPKSAEIESVQLIRGIKSKNSLPLSEDMVRDNLSAFFVSKTDIDSMSRALDLINGTTNDIVLLSKATLNIEPINLQRACSGLQEIPNALRKNMNYAQKMLEWQDIVVGQVTTLLNSIRSLETDDEKKAFDKEMSAIFERTLRSKEDLSFKFEDIINEAHMARVKSLAEMMEKGSFFKVKLEEHLKKEDISSIIKRIPQEDIEKVEVIGRKMSEIRKGVERAYEHNMRMLNLAVVLYAYIRWIGSKQ